LRPKTQGIEDQKFDKNKIKNFVPPREKMLLFGKKIRISTRVLSENTIRPGPPEGACGGVSGG
jgi:hypothetical protein